MMTHMADMIRSRIDMQPELPKMMYPMHRSFRPCFYKTGGANAAKKLEKLETKLVETQSALKAEMFSKGYR